MAAVAANLADLNPPPLLASNTHLNQMDHVQRLPHVPQNIHLVLDTPYKARLQRHTITTKALGHGFYGIAPP